MACRSHKVEEEERFDKEHGLQKGWWKTGNTSIFSQVLRKERKVRLGRVYARTRSQLRRGVITPREAAEIFRSVGCFHCLPTKQSPPKDAPPKIRNKRPTKNKKSARKTPAPLPKKESVDDSQGASLPPTPSYDQLLAGVGVD